MPKQVAKSSLAARLGGKLGKAISSHKDDETTYGNPQLPDGIEGGVAQLVECKFGDYESGQMKGKPYFLAAGIVMLPKEHDGIPTAGLRTQIGPEPLCETPNRSRKTLDEHIEWVLNVMRQLGIDTTGFDEDSLEPAAEALKEAKPFFRFRTWKGSPTPQFPNPRVNHEWNGLCDYQEGDEETVVDETADGDEPADDEQIAEAVEEADEGEDLDALAKDADGKNQKKAAVASARLEELAEAAGVDADDVKNAESWAAVVELIQAADGDEGEGEEGEGEEAAEEWEPADGEVYKYKPPKSKKAVECEVTKVLAKNQLVNLKNLDDGKTVYKAVKWADLVQE